MIFSISYIIGIFIVYLIDKFSDKYHLSENGRFIILFPFISYVNIIYVLICEYQDFLKHKKELKERFEKIESGNIKISSFDPFGEEDWKE